MKIIKERSFTHKCILSRQRNLLTSEEWHIIAQYRYLNVYCSKSGNIKEIYLHLRKLLH